MICRLCLKHDFEDFVLIFDGNHSDVANKIAKYLQLSLLPEDTISNKICQCCWKHLEAFHAFYQLVDKKQKSLGLHLEEEYECSILNVNEVIETLDSSDVKEVFRSEQPVDKWNIKQQVLTSKQLRTAGNEFLAVNAEAQEINKKNEEEDEIPTAKTELTPTHESTSNISDQVEANVKAVRRGRRLRACKIATEINKACVGNEKTTSELACSSKQNSSVISQYDAYIAQYGSLTCCLCKQSLQNFNELKTHFRTTHKSRGYVLCCNNRYAKRSQYVDHLRVHNDPEFFKCKECGKPLANRNSYHNHMASCHPSEEELKFPCSICEKKFARQYILDYHMSSHQDDERPEKCDICQKTYRSLTEMKRHQQRVHFSSLKIICDICGKHFKSKQSFLKHSEVMHQLKERPEAECKICGKWLKDEGSLFKHMYKHRDEMSGKEFVCTFCGVVKKTRSTLQSHIRYHHAETKHTCTLCEKSFKRLRSLEEHMATHTGETLYTCNYCPQTFRSHANMHNHKKKQHPNEWVRKFTQPRKRTADNMEQNKDNANSAVK